MITRKFESRFKQRNEETVNAAASPRSRNAILSMESPVEWGFARFLEGALTVAVEGGVTIRTARRPRHPGMGRGREREMSHLTIVIARLDRATQ